MDDSSRQMLSRLRVCLEAGIPAPKDVATWWLEGEEEFVRGDAKTLCAALGLRKAGKQAVQYSERMRRRNEALASAFELVPGDKPWKRKEALAEAIAKHSRRRRPPASPTPLDEAIRQVYAAGVVVPMTATGIHRALNEATQN